MKAQLRSQGQVQGLGKGGKHGDYGFRRRRRALRSGNEQNRIGGIDCLVYRRKEVMKREENCTNELRARESSFT
jgi:hypothetical protein